MLTILAAVAINMTLGNNGIFNRAKTAKEQYQNLQDYEDEQINIWSNEISSYTSSNRNDWQAKCIELEGKIKTLEGEVAKLKKRYKSGIIELPTVKKNSGQNISVSFEEPFEDDNYSVFATLKLGDAWATLQLAIRDVTKNGFVIRAFNPVIQNFDSGATEVYWFAIPYSDN